MTVYQADAEKIRKFLRFEIGYSEIGAGLSDEVVWDEDIRITFYDVLNALYKMKENHMSVVTCDSEYISPLMELADRIHLADAIGYYGAHIDQVNWNEALDRVPFDREATLFSVVAYLYHEADSLWAGEDRIMEADEWIDMMENTLENEHLPVTEWKLTPVQQMHFLMYVHEHDLVDYLTPEKRELFGRCLDEMCEQGVYSALGIRADSCAGGDFLYDCDWSHARDVYEILVNDQEDVISAMKLGDIYYEGKCGQPDYDKAWKYYSIASMAGIHEGMLKCADMLAKGQSVPVNTLLACSIAKDVYSRTKTAFVNGDYTTAFADAALRLGEYYLDGVGTEQEPLLAGSYLLDCRNALNCRKQYAKRDYDEELERELEEQTERLLTLYPALFTAEQDCRNEPFLLDRLLSGGVELCFILHRTEDGYCAEVRRVQEGVMILTIEQMQYSRLKQNVIIQIEGMESTNIPVDTAIPFDRVGYDREAGKTTLWYKGECRGYLVPDCYLYEDDRPADYKEEAVLTFAAVRFGESDGIYDYICELPDVKHGDQVTVDVSGRIEIANVCWVFREKMSDMPLHKDRYKYVLSRMNDHSLS